jgi:hypothetical protein
MSLQNQSLEEKINSLENLIRVSLDELRTRIFSEVDLRIKAIERSPNKESDQNIKNTISSLANEQKKEVGDIKQRILNEVESKIKSEIDFKLARFRLDLERETNNADTETFESPPLNYEILPPEDTPEFDENKSSVFMEIPYNPEELHVLGLKGDKLYWVKTEDC